MKEEAELSRMFDVSSGAIHVTSNLKGCLSMAGKIVTTMPSDLEIKMERWFTAPVELVFRAHGDADLIAKWWGQRGSVTTVERMDFRTGGGWRFTQTTPEGDVYGFSGEYREVTPTSTIVQTFKFDPIPDSLLETITFEQIGDQTKVSSLSVFDSKEARDGMAASGMEAGANESFDRLEELLEELKQEAGK